MIIFNAKAIHVSKTKIAFDNGLVRQKDVMSSYTTSLCFNLKNFAS